MLEDDLRARQYNDYVAVMLQNQVTATALAIGSEYRPPQYLEMFYPDQLKQQKQSANEAAKQHIYDIFGVTFEEVNA